MWLCRVDSAELGFLPFIRLVNLYFRFLTRLFFYKMEFYNSLYSEKFGQRSEFDLCWQLWEKKGKEVEDRKTMKLDELKEKKQVFLKIGVYNDILIEKSYKK